MFEIRRYTADNAEEWNRFVAQSRQGTFLFDRGYMDYHSDRFADHSLMFYLKGHLYALLPANEHAHTYCSHQGLTYGGLLTCADATVANVVTLFAELNHYLASHGFKKVLYKAIPSIYHRLPAEEDLYALFRTCHARLVTCDASSTIDLSHPLKWHHSRHEGISRARRNGIEIEADSSDFAAFWQVLSDNLGSTYGAAPVHTLDEMLLLKRRFPHNITLYTARHEGKVVGGTVLYRTPQVVHTQYISANKEGKQLRALDALFHQILHIDLADEHFFDFGKSTEQQGHVLNESLIWQKEGFGGRTVCYNWYEWEL